MNEPGRQQAHMTQRNPSEERQRRTVVEQGTEFKGVLSSSCPIDVHGRVEGELSTPALTVSSSGAVHGRAKVGSVHSEGELSGEFDADSVELAGRICDNTVIRARSLHVKLAVERGKLQVVFGECELSVGDEPATRLAAAESSAVASAVVDLPSVVPPATASASAAPSAPDPSVFDVPPVVAAPAAEALPAAPAREEPRAASKNGAAIERRTSWSQPPPAS
jgi:cytoskeletal protein CcmA (bactofilin family)